MTDDAYIIIVGRTFYVNKCTECVYSAVRTDGGIPCYTGGTEIGDLADIYMCPFCRSPRISPQAGGNTKCGCFCTEYTCGTKMVVNYGRVKFAAINYISDLCDDLHIDMVENTI